MTDLVEKVAREICLADGIEPSTMVKWFDSATQDYTEEPAWMINEKSARAALRIAIDAAAKAADERSCECSASHYATAKEAIAANEMARSIAERILSLLPKEPTERMLKRGAMAKAMARQKLQTSEDDVRQIYAAMLPAHEENDEG
jgi:hypothetical protein